MSGQTSEPTTQPAVKAYNRSASSYTKPYRVGELQLGEERVFTSYYEYAAYWDNIKCAPQTVELRSDGRWLSFVFIGTLTGGGRQVREENIGTECRYGGGVYAYELRKLLDGSLIRGVSGRLDDGVIEGDI